MTNPAEFESRVLVLRETLQKKLGVRGATLDKQMQRAGRILPKRVRAAGDVLTQTDGKIAHPMLARQVDQTKISNAFREIEAFLKEIDPADRRRGKVLNWLGGTVFNLLLIGCVVVVVMRWRGLI